MEPLPFNSIGLFVAVLSRNKTWAIFNYIISLPAILFITEKVGLFLTFVYYKPFRYEDYILKKMLIKENKDIVYYFLASFYTCNIRKFQFIYC